MHKKRRIPRALDRGGAGRPSAADRARVKEALGGRDAAAVRLRWPLRPRRGGGRRRSSIISTAASSRSTIGASPSSKIAPRREPSASWDGCGCSGRPGGASGRPRRWGPTSAICWRGSAIRSASRSCTRVDYRKALANPGSADERRHGRDLSRAIAHDAPVARDLASNLLDTVDRLSSARDPPRPARRSPARRRRRSRRRCRPCRFRPALVAEAPGP